VKPVSPLVKHYPYHLRKDLQRAAEELEAISFIRIRPEESRFRKVGRGAYEVTFEKQNARSAYEPRPFENSSLEDHPLYSALTKRGVGLNAARDIIASGELSDARVQEHIEVHDWLVKNRDVRISKNSAGFLVTSIRENYPMPDGFRSQADIKSRREAQVRKELARMKKEQALRSQEQENFETERQKVLDYLSKLPSDEARTELERAAVAKTKSLWRTMYNEAKEEGGERYEYLSTIILYDYVFENSN